MSKNNKNRRKLMVAKSFSEIRKSGGKGPARTEKKHTKRNVWYRTGDRAIKAGKPTVEVSVVDLVSTNDEAATAAA